jgi:uncharacterized lipoprotein YmbA
MRILIVLAISLLAACASAPPEHSTYLLRSDKGTESKQLSFDSGAYLGGLTLADYIDQPGLVLDQGEGKIHAARHHEWAEPLRVSLRQFLSAEISAQLGRDVPPYKPAGKADQRLDVSIDSYMVMLMVRRYCWLIGVLRPKAARRTTNFPGA